MWRMCLFLVSIAAVCLLPSIRPNNAAAVDNVDVTVTIITYQEIECPDDTLVPCPGDYYARVAIGPHDFVDSPQGPTDTGLFSPNWRITQTVDRDAGQFIPVRIELWDDDEDGINNDDQVDITGGADKTLDMTLDLGTGNWTGEAGPNGGWTSGAGDDPDARVLFDISLSNTGDFDGDGIPDGIERFGIRDISTGNVLTSLTNFGTLNPQPADPCKKTILLEVDWMAGAVDGHSHMPKNAAVTEVQTSFANAPVPATPNCPYTQLGFGATPGVQLLIDRGNSIPEQAVQGLGPTFDTIRDNPANFQAARRPYFHYALFVHQQTAGSSSSGLCCEDGKDFVVSLGTWRTTCVGAGPNGVTNSTPVGDDQPDGNGNITNGADRTCNSSAAGDDRQLTTVGNNADHDVGTARDQSGTIMHELGHALGLEHRGNSDLNHTANYLSNMNYLFQSGIPNNGAAGSVLDYSSAVLPTLDESTLNESTLLGGPATRLTAWFDPTGTIRTAPANGGIDWNQNGAVGTVSVDINNDAACVGPGANNALNTTPGGDDAVANGVIHNGVNNICETTPSGDDVRPVTGSGGTPINVACIDTGPNGTIESTRSGDDVLFTNRIQSGPNTICNSTASGDDVQSVPVGVTEANLHPGYNDWINIRYRASLSVFAAGATSGHFGDIDFAYTSFLENRFLELLDPDLKATKTVDKTDAAPGDLLGYTVKAENIGTGDAASVKFSDTLPDGTVVERTPTNILSGGSRTESFTYTVPCGTADGTVLTNNVLLTATDLQAQAEANTTNNSASATTTVHAPVLTLDKSATANVNAGEAITYTLTYANTGSGDGSNVTIVDTVPAGVYYSPALDLGAGPKSDSVVLNGDGTRTLTWNVGTVAANSASTTIEFTARPTLLALAGTLYTNSASLTFTDKNGCTYPPVSDSADTTITVVAPNEDVRTLGFWGTHPELWTSEVLARIQATDQRYDGRDGSSPDGALASAEVAAMFVSGGNQPKVLEMQTLALYFNLATRRINAGTLVHSRTAAALGVGNVREAALYAIDTLALPVTTSTKSRYSDATRVLDEINTNRSPVW